MTIQEKRAQLKELSAQAKEIKEMYKQKASTPEEALKAESLTLNQIIIKHFYKSEEHQEFNTFGGWLKEGKAVKKGEKAFLIWGRPKAVQEQEKGNEPPKDEEGDFYPVSFIFSNAQVTAAKPRKKKEPSN